jgi:predicted RNA polymerase sigma factor
VAIGGVGSAVSPWLEEVPKSYERALRAGHNAAERRFLERRLREVQLADA